MNLEQVLLEKVRSLSPEKRQEVLDFAEFLEQKTADKRSSTSERKPGLHPGAFVVQDDFDQPLPDSFWLGEE